MSFKTKAILNLVVAGIFIVLAAVHICDGESALRIVCGDIIPAIWFGGYATVCFVRFYRNK